MNSLPFPRIQLVLGVIAVSAISAVALRLSPDWLISPLGMKMCLIGTVFVSALFILQSRPAPLEDEAVTRSLLRMLWFFLLISEELFDRASSEETDEHFSAAVNGEISVWFIIALLTMAVALIRMNGRLRSALFYVSPAAAYCAVCMLSVAYSAHRPYSAVWCIKLGLVIAIVGLYFAVVHDAGEVLSFLRTSFWAYAFLMIYGTLADISSLNSEGRLGESPTSLAVVSGIVFVLSLALHACTKAKWLLLFTGVAPVIMLLTVGKAGIIGGIVSVVLYFGLRRKAATAGAVLIGFVCLAGALIAFVGPLHSYASTYAETGQVDNFSGRTDLWNAAVPLIEQRLLLGHGYMASKYIALNVEDVHWEAGHLHNSFLDVAYNTGLLGLGLIVYLNSAIVKRLIVVLRGGERSGLTYEISAASLAIYINLFINSCFNAIIGGRPSALFMLFIALVAAALYLRDHVVEQSLPLARPVGRVAAYQADLPAYGDGHPVYRLRRDTDI